MLATSPVLAQYAGGTQMFSNWSGTGETPLSASSVSANVALPSGGLTLRVCNQGNVDAYVKLGTAITITAALTDTWIPAGTCQALNLKPFNTQYTYLAGITASGSTTLRAEAGLGVPFANPWSHSGQGVYTLGEYGAPNTAPADTNEDTLATVNVPANAMGANGCLIIQTVWSYTNGANLKTMRVRFLSTTFNAPYFAVGATTFASTAASMEICNRNATNSQISRVLNATGPGNSTSLPFTGSVDTTDTSLLEVLITGTKASAGDVLTLESYSVRIAPSP
jgi:hypothetical protein